MDTKVIESALVMNPKYSSDWISTAAKLIANYNYSEEQLTDFCTEQLDVINSAHEYNTKNKDNKLDISVILNPRLNATQMRLLIAGQQNGISVETLSTLVNENIPYAISNYIVQGHIEGFNMSNYVKGYTTDQVYEIYAGLHNGIDINAYAHPEISADIMGLMRHAIELGKSVTLDLNTQNLIIRI